MTSFSLKCVYQLLGTLCWILHVFLHWCMFLGSMFLLKAQGLICWGNPHLGEWKLGCSSVDMEKMRHTTVADMFTSKENAQCLLSILLREPDMQLGTDALAHLCPVCFMDFYLSDLIFALWKSQNHIELEESGGAGSAMARESMVIWKSMNVKRFHFSGMMGITVPWNLVWRLKSQLFILPHSGLGRRRDVLFMASALWAVLGLFFKSSKR